jgi:hypothetical protein
MRGVTYADLYRRGSETLLAAWEEYARAATGASVQCAPGVATAVFPSEPEHAFYNNALFERDLEAAERAKVAPVNGALHRLVSPSARAHRVR